MMRSIKPTILTVTIDCTEEQILLNILLRRESFNDSYDRPRLTAS